jgi:hypothetical protein
VLVQRLYLGGESCPMTWGAFCEMFFLDFYDTTMVLFTIFLDISASKTRQREHYNTSHYTLDVGHPYLAS